MSEPTWHCPGCGTTTRESGFFIDQTYGGRFPLEWGAGGPEQSFWRGTKQPEQRWSVQANRCTGCGLLQLYATHPVT